jgi:hypothetical protein
MSTVKDGIKRPHVNDYLLELPSDSNLTQLPNCFVDGDQPNQTLILDFTKSKTSAYSKIKEKRTHRLENDYSLECPLSLPTHTQHLCLNCFVDGDLPNHTFPVEILKSKNVGILKDLIKEKKAPYLDHVAASDLEA